MSVAVLSSGEDFICQTAGSRPSAVELTSAPNEAGKVEKLVYSADDDEAIEQFLRENIQTTWHQLGTAKMAPQDQMGVVDANLNVYGVQGLKLADLSIAPENVAAKTMNTALLIGKKAAGIIVRELGSGVGGKTTNGVNGSTANGLNGVH